MSPFYTFEMMLPLIVMNLRSNSQSNKMMAQECTQMIAYLTQGNLIEKITQLGRYTPASIEDETGET